MSHRRLVPLIPLCLITALSLGCVPVDEPLSDPDKAEPDKELMGRWHERDSFTDVDAPTVKGNPKGLMRAADKGRSDDPECCYWFFTTKIGKHTYATIYLKSGKDLRLADFGAEGAYEKWTQAKDPGYYIVRLTRDGDKLTVDGGDRKAMEKLMRTNKIVVNAWVHQISKTAPGLMAKYFEKGDEAQIFKGEIVFEYRREKE